MTQTATQHNIRSSSSAETVTTYKAFAAATIPGDFKGEILGKEYIIESVGFRATWTGEFHKSRAVAVIGFYTIVAGGKKGQKYGSREFTISDAMRYTNLPADLLSALEAQFDVEVAKAVA